jgi:hypothetical protein
VAPRKSGEPSSKPYETASQNDSDLVFTRVRAKVKILQIKILA